MSNGTPQNVNPSSDPYARGFQTGCLLGCAPLILLILFVFVIGRIGFLGFDDFESGGDPAVVFALPEIAESATEENLLPKPPRAQKSPIYVGDDLSRVPLLTLEAVEKAPTQEWQKRKAHTVAAALFLNQKEEDGFLKAVLRTRPDLAGLPFTMGNACRTTGDMAQAFTEAVRAVRTKKGAALVAEPDPDAEVKFDREVYYHARLAAASQVIPDESAADRQSLIRGLASIARPDAMRRLAHLAVYSPDEEVRNAALEALAARRGEDATKVLTEGLQYPWPAVAENAAAAIVKLKRNDLIPQLEAMLKAPDPRAPKLERVDGREETVVYELVRLNHLQNCLLCHAPIKKDESTKSLSAEIPVPTMPLPDAGSKYYGESDSNLLVRIDVTYLRQDFSAMLDAKNWTAETWTPKQRFDFLLRRRVLSPDEAANLRKRLAGMSPYRQAAASALHSLTGKDMQLNPAQ